MAEAADRIEKKILLRAPCERVWRAISDARQFGHWFGVEFDGAFVAGTRLIGRIAPTKVDAEVAKLQQPYTGKPFEVVIDRVEPMRLFSFRWHPFAIDPAIDYSKEPATLVVFELQEVTGGTLLTITESGFDRIPLERRARAFAANDQGWQAQTRLIEKYLAQPS
ncbi:MAG TPA: SRPBCC family protein [Burkholderiaceae bacterium]|nr:SRPBCC family protein [Burkholderiaceae bacterium]